MSGKTADGVAPPSELWDVDRLAAYLGAPKSFVYRLTRQRRIRFVRVGKELRFDPADVAAYLAREAVPVEPRPAVAPHRPISSRRSAGRAVLAPTDHSATVRVRAPW